MYHRKNPTGTGREIMKKIASIAGVAGAVVAGVLLVGPAANAASTVTVHPSDFIAGLADTRSAGHFDTLSGGGLSVYTDDATSQAKVAEYWAPSSPSNLPGAVTLDWSGTQPQPGTQIVFDYDQTAGNGNDYNILVGEPVYNDPDGTPTYWLTNSSSADAHAVCPRTTGGSGTACWGTLAQWRQAIQNADVQAYGFSLGSGVKGSGVIHSLTVDSTAYTFAADPGPTPPVITPTNVSGASKVFRSAAKNGSKTVSIVFHANPLGADQSEANPLSWEVKDINGTSLYSRTQHAGQQSTFKVTFKAHTSAHTLYVYKNGTVVRTINIHTGAEF